MKHFTEEFCDCGRRAVKHSVFCSKCKRNVERKNKEHMKVRGLDYKVGQAKYNGASKHDKAGVL